jgi:hypothetical protein
MEKNPYSVAFPAAALRQFAAVLNGASIPAHELPNESHLYFAANRLEYGSKTEAAYLASLDEFERDTVDDLLEFGKRGFQPAVTMRSFLLTLTRDRYSLIEIIGFAAAVYYWPQSAMGAFGIWLFTLGFNLLIKTLAGRRKAVA